ncbi:MAG: hypothetical protein QG627_1252 [Chlamydiota bacterium]|jgi:hypothetical protein|nr:hypothetical protein [Chlamydiota bacterium]
MIKKSLHFKSKNISILLKRFIEKKEKTTK